MGENVLSYLSSHYFDSVNIETALAHSEPLHTSISFLHLIPFPSMKLASFQSYKSCCWFHIPVIILVHQITSFHSLAELSSSSWKPSLIRWAKLKIIYTHTIKYLLSLELFNISVSIDVRKAGRYACEFWACLIFPKNSAFI